MNLDDLEPIYFSNEDDLDEKLFTPILNAATSCRCMTGYFSSGALRELSFSISQFFSISDSCIQFLVSPNLSIEDLKAIRLALDTDVNLIPLLFPEFHLSEDTLKTKTLEALSYLIVTERLEIRFAIQDKGLFHTKCWLMDTEDGMIAIHGSGNATGNGLSVNFEQLTLSRAWISNDADIIVSKLSDRFTALWDNSYDGITTINLNRKTIDYLSNIYQQIKSKSVKDIAEELSLYCNEPEKIEYSKQKLKIPNWLNYSSGDFSHQGQAVNAWMDNQCMGMLSIATGGGKTLTSLVAASWIMEKHEKLFLVIAVPTKALLEQWAEDVNKFGVKPINSSGMSSSKVAQEINSSMRKLKSGVSNAEVIIITHEGLKNERFIKLFKKVSKDLPLMLIGDEVHNLGSVGFQQAASDEFKYRLGLSATVVRQFDDEGTSFLFKYFGPVVYDYPLKEAIGKCLVPFKYYAHTVVLDELETEEWTDLTYSIRKLSYASELSDGAAEKERWKLLCLKRRRIVESAHSKASKLAEILPTRSEDISRALVFCTDKNPEQLETVNQLLISRSVSFHQVTADETKSKSRLNKIVEQFAKDQIQVLTSKRVLDEGFNVPQTETAYILASNTVTRQWVQRLGRVLRQSSLTNKKSAVIHDFVVLPPVEDGAVDPDLNSLITGELSRVQFFDSLSMNGLEAHGAADVIEELMELSGIL